MYTHLLINKNNYESFIWSCFTCSLHICLSWQFVWEYSLFVSPLNVRWSQTRSLGLKVWGAQNIFRGWRLLFLLYFLIKNFLGKTKFRGAEINLWGIGPKCHRGYRPDFDFPDTSLNRHYLTKQSSSDKRGLTVVTVIFGTKRRSIKHWMLAILFSYIKHTGL